MKAIQIMALLMMIAIPMASNAARVEGQPVIRSYGVLQRCPELEHVIKGADDQAPNLMAYPMLSKRGELALLKMYPMLNKRGEPAVDGFAPFR